jgi:hypothetical protein
VVGVIHELPPPQVSYPNPATPEKDLIFTFAGGLMSRSNSPIPPNRAARAVQVPGANSGQHHDRIRQINYHRSIPAWLRSLLTLQRGARILFGLVFAASALGYGYTVYTQSVWKQQHRQLKQLQTQERQQGMMTENLKHQLAIAAEQPTNNLQSPDPKQIVFIPSAPLRPTRPLPTTTATTSPKASPPSGY